MASQEPLVQVGDHHTRPWAAYLHRDVSGSVASLSKHTCMHVHAHPLFRNFTIVWDRKEEKSASKFCQGLHRSSRRDEGWTAEDEDNQQVASVMSPIVKHQGLTMDRGEQAGSAGRLWTASSPHQPPPGHQPPPDFLQATVTLYVCFLLQSINRSSWAQLCSVPHLALPFAPTRSKRYPATTAAMFSTHVTEVQTTIRGAGTSTTCQAGPRSPHLPSSSSSPSPPQTPAPLPTWSPWRKTTTLSQGLFSPK